MEVIQSFTIDHTRLKPGIYVSRQDKGFTTFDLRIYASVELCDFHGTSN